MGARARTGSRVKGGSDGNEMHYNGELAAHGHGLLNDNGEPRIPIATNYKLALMTTLSRARKGATSHTHNITIRRNDLPRIDYILTHHGHRPRVQYVVVPPRPLPSSEAEVDRNNV